MSQEFVQDQFRRVPSFSTGVVSDVNEYGKIDVNTGGRAASRSQLGGILAESITTGSHAIMLGGGENDQAQFLGYSPFLGG